VSVPEVLLMLVPVSVVFVIELTLVDVPDIVVRLVVDVRDVLDSVLEVYV
jgi:hypothetical protein